MRMHRPPLAMLMLLAVLAPLASVCRAQAPPAPLHKISPEAARLAPLFKAGAFTDTRGTHLPYRYFEPGAQADAKYPVIVYLHGEDEAGTDNAAQITMTECATVWVEPRHLKEHPVYVLAPQIRRGETWTSDSVYAATLALLDRFLQDHPTADANRVYLVGFSTGATGVWHLLLQNPQRFAAAMPISGSADAYLGDHAAWAALRNTPVIILHSYDDTVVPVSAAVNAAAALQAGGNSFLGYGAPTPCLWSPGSTASPHDAWYTAFHKFEVVYNSLFLGDLGRTQHGAIDPTTLYTSHDLGDGITEVWDYALGTSFIIERADKAVIIDATMGHGGLYAYIRDHVLKNKQLDLEVFITHQHNDHILGLASFVGASQLKKVYVHQADSQPVMKVLGPDAGKVSYVRDGDLIPLGGSNVEVIGVPGHTLGSIVMKYQHYLFSGDSVGTGYVGVGTMSIEEYTQSLRHLLAKIGDTPYTVYGGHTGELTAPLTAQYVRDMLTCAEQIVNHSIAAPAYWRSGDVSTRRVSTVGRSSITYNLNDARLIAGALQGLQVSQGTLTQGYEPQFASDGSPNARITRTVGFASYISYYDVTVAHAVGAFTITPTVRNATDRGIRINNEAVKSGEAYQTTLVDGDNRFAIVVTAADGTTRTYTLNVTRSAL